MDKGELETGGEAVPVLDCSSASGRAPLAAGMLSRLLSGADPLPQTFSAACVQLCGHMTVMCSSFSGRADFLLLLQSMNTLEEMLERGASRECVEEVALSCVQWLHCLECYTHRYVVQRTPSAADMAGSREVAKMLVACLPLVVGHLNSLECLLVTPTSALGWQQSCACHVTRLSLHIHWTVLSVMYRLTPLVGWSWFLSQARRSLSSLLSHAASLHTATSAEAGSGLPGCHCTTQLWLLLRHTLDHAAAATATPASSFWSVVTSLLYEALNTSQPHPSDTDCEEGVAAISPSDAVNFCWWCVRQLAPLYGFSEEGRHFEGGELTAHWDLVHHLLPLTLRQASTEVQLRYSLRVCVALCGVWPSSLLPVTQAWDYYYKHMDDPFVTTARSISEWASPDGSSPRQWLQYLLSLYHSTDATTVFELRPPASEANSFKLFLCLIHATIATGARGGDGGSAAWRQLRGRFYSKLHRRWLSERSGVGLHRVMSLLLTLAWAGDPREVAQKTVSLLTQIGLGEALEHSPLLWRAVFTMLLLLEERGEGLEDIISKLHPALTSLARPHPPESRDLQWKALNVVLDGTVEVMESAKGISLGAVSLIGSHLSDLLTSTEGSHMTRVLGFVESLSTLLTLPSLPPSPPPPSVLPSPHTTACRLLWQHCSQQLVSLLHLPLPPSPLPSTLATLTALTCHQQHTSHNTSPLTIFQEVTKDTTNPTLASVYLSHVIESDIIRHHILDADGSQVQALHTWLRSLAELDHTPPARSPAVAVPSTASQAAVEQLTNQLPKLPVVTALLSNQSMPTDPMSMLQQLLEAIEASYMRQEGGGGWREKLHALLGDLPHYLELSVAGTRGAGAIKHAYRVAGLVVAKCPQVTYSRTDSRCLLPRLVDWLVLPLSSSRRPQAQGAAAAIRSQLHLFLSGLLRLEPQRDDFIRRKVKQLFSRYFHQFCQPPSPLMSRTPNPFLITMQPWFQRSHCGDREQLRLVVEVIASQCLSLPQQPASLSPTLQFIKNVVERVQSPLLLVTMAPPLLGHMTSCLLACDVCPAGQEPPGIRSLVMGILTPLITACREYPDLLPRSSLQPILRDFVTTHSSVDEALVARPLVSLGDLYPDLVLDLIPLLGDDNRMQSIGHTLLTKFTED